MSGREPSSGPPDPVPPAGASPGALMRWNVDVVNSHRVAARRVLWTPTTYIRFPDVTVRGPDEIAAHAEGAHTALPDLAVTILSLVEDGEQVHMRWRVTGTHTGGPCAGIEPTGARIDVDGADHAVFADGAMVSNFVIYDRVQFARQVGLMPADRSRLDVGIKWAFNRWARTRR